MNNHYLENLIKQCQIAKSAKSIKTYEYEVKSCDFKDFLWKLKELKDVKSAIYIFEEIDPNIQLTFDNFKKVKSEKKRAFPKINKPSEVLYVGSSTTNLSNRLKQHLGFGTDNTYSLHLNEWFEGIIRIKIYCYDEDSSIIQLIEDNISFNLSPAFGKKGGNNK